MTSSKSSKSSRFGTSSKSSKSSKSSSVSSSSSNSSSNSSSSSDSSSSASSLETTYYFGQFLGDSIKIDEECYSFTKEVFSRRDIRDLGGVTSGFIDCADCYVTFGPCGTPNDDPTIFATFSWTDADVTKSWLGCTWTNGETKEVFASTYSRDYASTIFPNITGVPWDGAELWKKKAGNYDLLTLNANPVRYFQVIPGTPSVFDYRKWQYQELDLKYSINQRRFWINTFYYTYGGGPPTGATIQRFVSAGTPIVVTGATDPSQFNITQNRISDNMLNGQMLYASGLRFKWEEGNGWS